MRNCSDNVVRLNQCKRLALVTRYEKFRDNSRVLSRAMDCDSVHSARLVESIACFTSGIMEACICNKRSERV